jgi:ribonucleotide reductase beta subunit family protein with ferritin-like domain
MRELAALVIENLRAIDAPEHAIYEDVLLHAMESAPPPFAHNWFGRRYFELATNADWFANSLVANAALEGYGATQIWKFSNRISEPVCATAVRQHALDESRHSSMFVRMLALVFPDAAMDSATVQRVDALQPKYSQERHPPIALVPDAEQLVGERLLNELIQVHITEIRALVLQFLLREMILTYAPDRNRERLERYTSTLIRDEARHIEYTAAIFESASRTGHRDFLFTTFEARLRDFNDLTMIELERENVTI